jgi:CMP-N-acetylneuraminic acid synthetase
MSDVLAIIPARTGSKGIQLKNFTHLHGITPVQRAVDCCNATHVRCIVSTDYEHATATNWLSMRRPAHLAQDDTPMIDVVRDFLEVMPGPPDEIILIVQPTQPLREPKHLAEAIRLMDGGAASVVSLTPTESTQKVMELNQGCVFPWDQLTTEERRQDARLVFRRDGTVYAFRRGQVNTDQAWMPWYLQPCVPLMVPKSETCELDTPDDWAIAEVRLAWKEAMARA